MIHPQASYPAIRHGAAVAVQDQPTGALARAGQGLNRLTLGLAMAAGLMAGAAQAAGTDGALPAPYPAAEAGQQRFVLELPRRAVEDDYQVELIAGKTVTKDCNNQSFIGNLEELTLQGWGYDYYRLQDVRGPVSTMMGCPPGSAHEAFVPVRGDGFRVRYNSKLPIVVYLPDGFQLHYRLWRASDETWAVQPD